VPRDLSILYTVGKLRVATRRQIQEAAGFGSPHTCRDRLAKLKEAGLLRVATRGLDQDSLYMLTARGHRLVVERFEIEAEELAVVRSVPRHADHFIATNDVRVAVASGLRSRPDLTLSFFAPAWELQQRGGASVELVPDALVGLATPGGEIVLAVEVDLGSESPNYVARRKVAVYSRLLLSGIGVFGYRPAGVVLLTRGAKRIRHLARAIVEAVCGRTAMLGNLDDPEARTLVGTTFASPADLAEISGDELLRRLRDSAVPALSPPLTTSPCRKGTSDRRGPGTHGRIETAPIANTVEGPR
jgi:hypothetical protein